MNKKKLVGGALLSAALLFGFSPVGHAYEKQTYASETKVQLRKAPSLQVQLNGLFEIENMTSREKTLLVPSVSVTLTAYNGTAKLTAGTDSYSAGAGFKVSEIASPPAKIVRFTSPTEVRKSAVDSSESIRTMKKIEAAEYITETTSSGVVWYNVQLSSGTRGWVSSKSSIAESAPSGLSLFKYNSLQYRGSFEAKADGSSAALYNVLGLEDYLKGVVPNEMPASWHPEALKAQAIVARSFAVNSMGLSNTAKSQVYNGYSKEDSRSNAAVAATEGVMVKHNGKPVQAFFYSTSGGKTANAWDVWGSSPVTFPYLKSVEDAYESSPHSSWTDTFRSAVLLGTFGFDPNTTVLYDIKANPTGQNGEIGSVTVTTSAGVKTITGDEGDIRSLFPVKQYYNQLRSNWFTLNPVQSFTVKGPGTASQKQFAVTGSSVMGADGKQTTIQDSQVTIQTASGPVMQEADPATIQVNGKGWGHRIGMSQYGANGYAKNGYKAEAIVQHYFPGTVVGK
ncbi:SpoIID/LytB domain-containing protein [Bacillus sp. FJAT-42376]|uniref:SpoIID/LytB domain-containing protein n=1 Tax=Bacillus sp. FJAT-42376 TaxID=2014076 RepID=UPI000F504933|nr:SpoIID/LytB domain-containing protein [Bacillus sp. FJAT-42376]AZB44551.1 SpoIID/LytB domain-containing protein [Bacillus sp. FJAT-42376]